MDIFAPKPNVPIYYRHQIPNPVEWAPKVEGWEPIYLEGIGNACLVYLADGGLFYVIVSSNTFLQHMARFYALNLKELRRRYRLCIHLSQSIPLPVLSQRMAFFAVKTRKPANHNDGAFGYIASGLIEEVSGCRSRSCEVTMKSGTTLHLYMSKDNLIEQRMRAENFLFRMLRDWGMA